MRVTFFQTDGDPPLRLRRTETEQGHRDDALIDGVWRPTLALVGHAHLEQVPSAEAATWETRPVAIDYLMSTKREPPLLLRQVWTATTLRQEAFLAGRWQPTKIVWDYMVGHNDFVEPITEEQARALEPTAL